MTDHAFQLTTIDVHNIDGPPVQMRALVCGGLAIHRNSGSHISVSVTHIGSGKAIMVGQRFDYVLEIMPRLLAACDWTRSAEDIFTDTAARDLCMELKRGDEWDDFSMGAILSDERP